jgi:hypothetical protein
MPIYPFTEQGAFAPEATAAMGEAFDAACKELREVGRLQMIRKVLAHRIVAAARKGELDPARLRAAALSGLPLTKMSPAAYAEPKCHILETEASPARGCAKRKESLRDRHFPARRRPF